ncbi:hypothetical protein ACFE04_006977 [Oxalis oulophora]
MEQFSGYPSITTNTIISSSSINQFIAASSLSSVDALTLQKQIDDLATFSDAPSPAVTRILYSHNDVIARRYVKNLMGLAALSVREDAVGNIFGRWDGSEPELPAVATGSHIDAIPYSGKYDGVVGVLGAVEAINALKRYGGIRNSLLLVWVQTQKITGGYFVHLRRAYTLWDQLLGKVKTINLLLHFKLSVNACMHASEDEDLSSVFLKKGTYSAFLELHIEQGPILEEEGTSIGVVTAIAAPASIKVDFEGSGGHAGAALMPSRNDAGLAAAELALAVEKHVLDSGSIDTVGTVGILDLHPGAINSIPSKSHVEIDTRDIDEKRRNTVIEKIYQSATSIAKNRRVKLSTFEIVNQDPPAQSEKSIIEAMSAASDELNLSHKLMISRAYHDSLFMAR